MIKILNIISDSNIGGAGKSILNYLKYCNKKEYDVVTVLPKDSLLIPEIVALKARYIEAEHIADRSFDRHAIGALVKIIRREKPHIVHTHGNLSGRIAAKICGVRIVYTRHTVMPQSEKLKKGVGKLANKLMNECLSDEIIAVANAAKDNLVEVGIGKSKIRVILNGVEQVQLCTADEIADSKAKYGIEEDDFVIGILARIDERKGHKFIIDAIQVLIEQGINAKALIAGTGPYEAEIRKYVAEKGLQERVIFAGFIKDIRLVLAIMNVQVNASYGSEATNLALLEGMSLGLPAVVSNAGGNSGVITNGENGFLFAEMDALGMARCIKKLHDDHELYLKMSARALEIYDEKFTARGFAANLETVYDAMLGKRRH